MPRKELANFLGMTPETLCHTARELGNDGLVRFNGQKVDILDEDLLAEMTELTVIRGTEITPLSSSIVMLRRRPRGQGLKQEKRKTGWGADNPEEVNPEDNQGYTRGRRQG